ncbi:MAG: secretin N-terminal domain-containing protein [Pseudomonadota bacterium]
MLKKLMKGVLLSGVMASVAADHNKSCSGCNDLLAAPLRVDTNTAFYKVREQQPAQETLNFNNTDIRSIIATVSARTGKNFIIDPRVRARVTMVTSEPVAADKFYDMLLSILQVHGFAAVPAGDFIKVVPFAVGARSAVHVVSESTMSGDELISEVIRIDYGLAEQVVEVVRPLLQPGASASAEPVSNTIVITDTVANIAKVKKIISKLDQRN